MKRRERGRTKTYSITLTVFLLGPLLGLQRKAGPDGLADPVQLSRPVVLRHEGGRGDGEGLEHAPDQRADLVVDAPAGEHVRAQGVDRGLNGDVGDGKEDAGDPHGHAQPGDLFIQKADASTIGDLAKAVQKLFGDTGIKVIGTRHGEKLYETLMTREERLRSEDMGDYFRVAADNRDLNYDKYFVQGKVETEAEESYTSHNTKRLDTDGVVKKLLTTDYVKEQLRLATGG